MKLAALLLFPFLLFAQANAAYAQTQGPAMVITVARNTDGTGWNITLPPDAAKTLTDQLWLVIDGKSEGFGGGNYDSEAGVFKMPLRYTADVSSDLDGQVKDILKAQGFPVKANTTTYHLSEGLNGDTNFSGSQTLHFRHDSYALINTQLPFTATYKIGDKIPIYDVLALDSSITMHDVLGKNDIEAGKFAHLPHGLLHRITIQVQFVPKTTP